MKSPRQLPFRANEEAAASELNLQDMLTGDASARTFTVPVPVQLPSSEVKKSDSEAATTDGANAMEAARSILASEVFIRAFFRDRWVLWRPGHRKPNV